MNPVDLCVFLIVGMALSLFGGGGAIILIPYLRSSLGMPVDQAALLSLLTIGANTGIQSVIDWRTIQWRAVAIFSLIAFPATALSGSFLAPVPPHPGWRPGPPLTPFEGTRGAYGQKTL